MEYLPLVGGRTMGTAPRDGTPILAFCEHTEQSYYTAGGKAGTLTPYGYYSETSRRVCDGPHVIQWVGDNNDALVEGYDDNGRPIYGPGWWFLADGELDTPVNPVCWLPVPLQTNAIPAPARKKYKYPYRKLPISEGC